MSKKIILDSKLAAGNGVIKGIKYIIFVNSDVVDSQKVVEQARIIEKLNAEMYKQKDSYILVGPGRWGSSSPMQGIPVKYESISNALSIVEVYKGTSASPSQGSHFFHNITSDNVHYLATDNRDNFNIKNLIDKKVLKPEFNNSNIMLLKSSSSITVYTDGKISKSVICLDNDE